LVIRKTTCSERINTAGSNLPLEGINNLFDLIKEAIDYMNYNLSNDYRPGILAKAKETELGINEMRDRLLNENSRRNEQDEITYQQCNILFRTVKSMRKTGRPHHQC